ncbi:ribonuclease P protein subunit p21 [Anopheles stephensi]|uniref:ribonuclease P protein subunit p21 n=1 Tax=Anopheles stephensi TaxID=30069 RepID=UPI00165897FF|nr:ribonuclease P protein subunit p21 [Anopheles stephensi]
MASADKEMKKSANDNKKAPQLCVGRESYERMNFLYQAAALMSETHPQLSATYGRLAKSIGKKAVLRMEPAIKRTLCVRCGVLLNPAITADIHDYRHKKLCYVQVNCKLCGYQKRFYNNKNHQLWLENPSSLVERIEFSSNK